MFELFKEKFRDIDLYDPYGMAIMINDVVGVIRLNHMCHAERIINSNLIELGFELFYPVGKQLTGTFGFNQSGQVILGIVYFVNGLDHEHVNINQPHFYIFPTKQAYE